MANSLTGPEKQKPYPRWVLRTAGLHSSAPAGKFLPVSCLRNSVDKATSNQANVLFAHQQNSSR